MTAGIPGAGIGGMFYLGNALWMPVREIWLALHGRSSRESRAMMTRQVTIALGIMASMWATAWFIGYLVNVYRRMTAASAGSAAGAIRSGSVNNLPRVLSYSALAVSGTTLLLVLGSVQLLRLLMTYPRRARALAFCAGLTLSAGLIFPISATAQNDEEQQYRNALQNDPDDSKAVFRLAQTLERRNAEEAEQLYRRYIQLEPDDAWGYIVFAEVLGRSGRFAEGLTLYSEAIRRAPTERDALCGRARMLERAGNKRDAMEAYENCLAQDPRDTDTKEHISYLRHLMSPAVEPVLAFSHDSDGNMRTRTSAGVDFSVADLARVRFIAGRTVVSDASNERSFTDFQAGYEWRPRKGIQLDAAGGAVNAATLKATTHARLRLKAPSDKGGIDLRFNRSLLDATPTLVQNGVVRNELQARPSVALTKRLRLRGNGGAGWITGNLDRNSRTTAGGGAAWSLLRSVELSGNFTQIQYAHPSQSGYFAPQRLQSIDVGSYLEFENDSVLAAIDLGAGAERFHAHGAAFGPWRPAFRGYGLISFKLRPGRELRFEVDTYDTQASAVAAPGPGWRYASMTASLRWAVR